MSARLTGCRFFGAGSCPGAGGLLYRSLPLVQRVIRVISPKSLDAQHPAPPCSHCRSRAGWAVHPPLKKVLGQCRCWTQGEPEGFSLPHVTPQLSGHPQGFSFPSASPFFSFLAAHCRRSCLLCHSALGRKRPFHQCISDVVANWSHFLLNLGIF